MKLSPWQSGTILRGALAAVLAALCSVCGAVFAIERDFDGDQRADVLWRHQGAGGTGENYFYPLNGTAILAGEGYLRTVSDMSWEVAGIGDFDGDGQADVLWHNQATGENYIYFMDGKAIVAEGFIRTVADSWKVAGIGDFDGDLRADILWRNSATGENYLYPMQGLTIKASEGYIRTVADQNWQVAGVGNFDGNAAPSTADILWRNRVTGENYIYFMNGTTIASEGFIRTVAGSSWKVAGVGDFDGDGKADILWRNSSTGENYIYPMQGLTIKASEGYLRTITDQNWQIVAVGNFDGNIAPATADILWRNFSTGENYLYPMNGTTILPSEGYLRTIADRDWKVQPPSACPVVSSSAITLSAVPSRTSGVAPLGVFFDATATTATATTRPFHALEYQWNFGDAGSGLWTATPGMPNLSRNLASGPVAAHVYEKPGTYTVCVTAFDGANTETTSIQITVTDPNEVYKLDKTRCIRRDATGTFDGCPADASQITNSDFDAVIASNIASGRRLLFRRGDTFTASTAGLLNVAGPVTIGAFGSGAKPLIEIQGGGDGVKIVNQDDPARSDFRIMDLEIDGNSGASTRGFYFEGQSSLITILRVDMHHVHVGIHMSPFIFDAFGVLVPDGVIVQDSTITTVIGGSGGNGVYIGATRFGFMGNTIDNTTGAEHVSRWPHLTKAVISHNFLNNPAATKLTVKMQAWPGFSSTPDDETKYIQFSDNKVVTSTAWAVVLGPQDTEFPEVVRDVIVERNWFPGSSAQQVAVFSMSRDHTIRNNIFNLSGTSQRNGVTVGPFPGASHGTRANVHVYNNTFYSGTGGSFTPIAFQGGAGHVAKNNLGYAPASTSRDMVSGTATDQNNTTDAGILVSPGFVGSTPAVPADFALGAASSAINAGAAVPVFSDLLRRNRPMSGAVDRGAFERP